MIEILIPLLLGILAGTFTGLTPGIHVNLINSLLLSQAASISLFFLPLQVPFFIIGMSLTHTFIDSIPSVFLGAPDSAMALGVLPGHRYLLKGHGVLAVKLTVVGSLLAIVFSMLFFPLFFYLAKSYNFLKPFIPFILLLVSVILIIQDGKKKAAIITYLFAGLLGLIILTSEFKDPLFPMLSGMFGVSTLLYSLKQKESLPEQKLTSLKIKTSLGLRASVSAVFAGGVTSIFPGIGSSTAAIIAQSIAGKIGDKGFMILIGGANTANFVLSLATWASINKARNGSVAALSEITSSSNVISYLFAILFSASIATFLAIFLSKYASSFFKRINYRKLTLGVILFVIVLVIILNGIFGMLILFTSTAVGLLPAILKCRRSHAMACLLVPVMFFMF